VGVAAGGGAAENARSGAPAGEKRAPDSADESGPSEPGVAAARPDADAGDAPDWSVVAGETAKSAPAPAGAAPAAREPRSPDAGAPPVAGDSAGVEPERPRALRSAACVAAPARDAAPAPGLRPPAEPDVESSGSGVRGVSKSKSLASSSLSPKRALVGATAGTGAAGDFSAAAAAAAAIAAVAAIAALAALDGDVGKTGNAARCERTRAAGVAGAATVASEVAKGI